MNRVTSIFYRPFFIRLFHWEYWSFNTVYGWIMPIWALLALRARSLFFFSASNPTIEHGGFVMESKKKIYDLLPEGSYPRTTYFKEGTPIEIVTAQINELGFVYPLVGKPDIGGRGRGVKKLMDADALINYAANAQLDYLIQEFVPQSLEVGVFYYRYPGKKKGSVSGIVRKEMLTITGDGQSTMRNLLLENKRFVLQMSALEKMYGHQLDEVLEQGKKKELVPYGNHARGAKFLDDSHLADEGFIESFDKFCTQVPGFYFGRLDIRFDSWEEFKNGQNFSVIELNGAGSEPTHIYDPRHSIFFAWKEIIRHWWILWKISRINHKNGIPYMSMAEGLQLMKANRLHEQKLNRLDV